MGSTDACICGASTCKRHGTNSMLRNGPRIIKNGCLVVIFLDKVRLFASALLDLHIDNYLHLFDSLLLKRLRTVDNV